MKASNGVGSFNGSTGRSAGKMIRLLAVLFIVMLPLMNVAFQTGTASAAGTTGTSSSSPTTSTTGTVPILVKFKSSATATDVANAIHAAGGQDKRNL